LNKKYLPLLMLGANENMPISGKTRFVKLMYIASVSLKKEKLLIDFYNFYQHYYGPYNDELIKDIESLSNEGYIHQTVTHNPTSYGVYEENTYFLTEEGKQLFQKYVDKRGVERIIRIFEEVKRKYASIPLFALIQEVYTKYPILK